MFLIIAAVPPVPQPIDFWSFVSTQTPVVAILCIGIALVGKYLLKAQAKISTLNDERLKEHKDRITALEVRTHECEKDREELHRQMSEVKRAHRQ